MQLQPLDRTYSPNSYLQILSRIPGIGGVGNVLIAAAFSNCLDKLEKIPVRFNAGAIPALQIIDFRSYVSAAKAICKALKGSRIMAAASARLYLKRRVAALQYRLESVNGGLDHSGTDPAASAKMQALAVQWKLANPLIEPKFLLQKDIDKINEVSSYPKFARLLVCDPKLQNDFFVWTVREGNNVKPFIEFPAIQEKIRKCLLSSRIGFFGGQSLRVEKVVADDGYGLRQKVLNLDFEGRPVSILDDSLSVTFNRGNYKLTIGEVFEVFRKKRVNLGNLEFFPNGVCNWSSIKMGWYDADLGTHVLIDLNLPEWWKQLPTIQKLTRQEAQLRYGLVCDGMNWVVTAKGSRQSLDVKLAGFHGYLEMAIPDGENYIIYNFGKVATWFPANIFEKIQILLQTVLGAIAYPEENIYYAHRQHTGYSISITREEGMGLMESIKKDIRNGRIGNLAFQLMIENCTKWVFKKLRKHLGVQRFPDHVYKGQLSEMNIQGFLGVAVTICRIMPAFIPRISLTFLSLFGGSFFGMLLTKKNGDKRYISVYRTPPWNGRLPLLHPANLFTFLLNSKEMLKK